MRYCPFKEFPGKIKYKNATSEDLMSTKAGHIARHKVHMHHVQYILSPQMCCGGGGGGAQPPNQIIPGWQNSRILMNTSQSMKLV
jgi:hypothetical protein